MSFLEARKLSAGELITASFGELAANRREILLYLGVFLVIEVVGSLVPAPVSEIAGLGGLLLFGGYFLGQYLLYRSLLRRSGHAGGRIRIFRFIGMAMVIGLAMLFASYLFIIPAILVGARWITAPCYIVATDKGVFASLGDSWSASRGNTLPLSLAFTAMVLVFGVLLGVIGAIGAAIESLVGMELTSGILAHVLPLLLMGLSVAAYRRLNEEGAELAAVFA